MLKTIQKNIQESEATIVSILVEFAPWLAPVAPAYMAYRNLVDKMDFYQPVAIAVALTVEMLGIATVNTALIFWRHNLRYKDQKKKSPTWIPAVAFCFYLGIILSVNALLDFPFSSGVMIYIHVLVKVLLTLLSVPAAVTLAVRTQHTELLLDIVQVNADRRNANAKHVKEESQVKVQVAEMEQEARLLAQIPTSSPYICPVCKRWFGKQQQLSFHMKAHKINVERGQKELIF